MERDAAHSAASAQSTLFQSTRSAWSVTRTANVSMSVAIFQSTRSAWSVTAEEMEGNADRAISIHTLRMERDAALRHLLTCPDTISIHTLRMERDDPRSCFRRSPSYFNPHAPHGA